jgi:hypothetical protein
MVAQQCCSILGRGGLAVERVVLVCLCAKLPMGEHSAAGTSGDCCASQVHVRAPVVGVTRLCTAEAAPDNLPVTRT